MLLSEEPLPDTPQAQQADAANSTAEIAVIPTSRGNCTPFAKQPPTPSKSGKPHKLWAYCQPVTAKQKAVFQLEEPFGPRGIFMPPISMAISYPRMTDKKGYPSDWTDGAGAFGRNLGDHYARNVTTRVGELLPALAFHERVRYTRSTSAATDERIAHALAGILVGESDSGRWMPSFVNFGGAAGSGFVGMAYLPDGYSDLTHAGQRSARRLAIYGVDNLFKEFSPEIVRGLHAMHIPKIPHFPGWWTNNDPVVRQQSSR